ncbi:hypothetical protein TCAL_10826 [Tigriopus californicus]|uniref:C2 domain-containing protein n=1 Tax=Tigriopus californicus TaxID=6832 RepID=A0A553NCI2_TIGCA|nr:extended synaptotagmin-3-like [Tigriopus californicus]XP_059092370.1 extended synaptotagmin-3-like [Tigriopus californicus]XP_059092372.1 extended synaptotagmin-3-like [Tigriopus californicus]XP_059092373.1 extended synaptotagmin-3-like [Tigriopus californicus]XP_059092374.1 extended synaptotagmin-3-like [Tigriopus californicus]XP_059092375.1 extended synaptotagmin-3-like [Tigriopus californicus]XP_059092376.1 extended synaptotagmin-3-like [Tigriopus californicus]TRY63162.1 hypothetical p|eukprot:TCALIF_10826-PA protein Name:"Similar to Esyt2 Extended synaptotagmin-2 (Mus musculus)" AED:0.07 eAED:0.07 QI:149/1/1/1/0/0/2/198/931
MMLPYALRILLLTLKHSLPWFMVYLYGYLNGNVWLFLLCSLFFYSTRDWTFRRKIREKINTATSALELSVLNVASEHDLPAWVRHPDAHRSEWSNVILKRLWPHLEAFLNVSFQNLEKDPGLQEKLGPLRIKMIRFPDFSLGKIPPKIGGIKVHQAVHRDEIIIDVSLHYRGDLRLNFDIVLKDLSSPLRSSINNFSFNGTLRIHLTPLLKDVPFVGGLKIMFLQAPEIDFDLGGMATSLDMPGIGLFLRHVIQDQLEHTIVMPHAIHVSMLDPERLAMLSAIKAESQKGLLLPAGVLTVNIIEGKGLVNKDKAFLGQGKSDPYAKLRIVADGMAHVFKTEVVPDNLHPVWNHVVDMPVDDPETLDNLQIEIWDEDRGSKDDFMGKCTIPVKVLRTAITSRQAQDVWKELEEVKKGSLHTEVSWSELNLNRNDSEDDFHKGVVTILVDSCSSLLGGRTGLKLPNPLVVAELCSITQSTETVIGSVNPVFSHRMNFLVRDPTSDTLKITVKDDKRDEDLGSIRIHLSDLLGQADLSFVNQKYTLTSRLAKGGKSPVVTLSLMFRYIHRPTTSSFGVHKSLRELHKIMATTLKPVAAVGVVDHSIREVQKPVKIAHRGPIHSDPTLAEDGDSLTFMDDTETASTTSSTATADTKENHNNISAITNNNNNNNYNNNIASPEALDEKKTDLKRQLEESYPVNNSVATTNGHLHDQRTITPQRNASINRSYRNIRPEIHNLPSSPIRVDSQPKVLIRLTYNIRTKTLTVGIRKVKNLQHTNFMSLPSPYVKTYLIQTVGVGCSRRIAHSKRKTSVRKQTVHPNFEESFEYFMPLSHIGHRRMETMVCSDSRILGRNSVIGRVIIEFWDVHQAILSRENPNKTDSIVVEDWHILNCAKSAEPMGTHSTLPRSRSTPTSSTLPRKHSSSLTSSPSFKH